MILRSVEKLCEIFVLQCMCCESTFSDNIRKVPWIWKDGLYQSSRGSPHVREVLIQNLFFSPFWEDDCLLAFQDAKSSGQPQASLGINWAIQKKDHLINFPPVWVGPVSGGQWAARVLGRSGSCSGGRLQSGRALWEGGCQLFENSLKLLCRSATRPFCI